MLMYESEQINGLDLLHELRKLEAKARGMNLDVSAAMLEAAGVAMQEEMLRDGIDFDPYFKATKQSARQAALTHPS